MSKKSLTSCGKLQAEEVTEIIIWRKVILKSTNKEKTRGSVPICKTELVRCPIF